MDKHKRTKAVRVWVGENHLKNIKNGWSDDGRIYAFDKKHWAQDEGAIVLVEIREVKP